MHTLPQSYDILCAGSVQERAFGTQVAQAFGLPNIMGEILYSRGLQSLDEVQTFLYPQLAMLPSPDGLKGMEAAVACIVQACQKRQPLFIHGDYDVDGISATALLVTFFRELGHEVYYYIPNRLEERYGLSKSSINRLVGQQSGRGGVLITADCGISAVEEVAYAREQCGVRIVVTDHHEAPERLPLADAIVNPKQPGCQFPSTVISGVGVAFFLLMGLRKAMNKSINLKKFLNFVALGTVADVVPLIGINRILVRAGLEVLSEKSRFGVFSLCESSGLRDREVLAEDIAFKLAPRINAAGRLGSPGFGIELLLAENLEAARLHAAELERMNRDRRELENMVLDPLLTSCLEQAQHQTKGITVYQGNCHVGVLGILASRLVDRCQRPVIVFADDPSDSRGQLVKGSGRSVQGMNLYAILEGCTSCIEQFGGHAMAAGLTVAKEQLQEFAACFDRAVHSLYPEAMVAKRFTVDYKLQTAAMLTPQFAHALQSLQPFGEGNPEPVFLLTSQKILAPRVHNGHLVFQMQGRGERLPGIGFHLAREVGDFGRPADFIFHWKRSWYQGVERQQIHALSIRSC